MDISTRKQTVKNQYKIPDWHLDRQEEGSWGKIVFSHSLDAALLLKRHRLVLEPNMLQFVAWYWFQQLLANISLMSSEEGAWEKKVPIWSNLTPLCKLSNEDKCWKMNPRLLDNSSASTISMFSSRDRTTFRSTCDTHPSSEAFMT